MATNLFELQDGEWKIIHHHGRWAAKFRVNARLLPLFLMVCTEDIR